MRLDQTRDDRAASGVHDAHRASAARRAQRGRGDLPDPGNPGPVDEQVSFVYRPVGGARDQRSASDQCLHVTSTLVRFRGSCRDANVDGRPRPSGRRSRVAASGRSTRGSGRSFATLVS
ncbi:hypothetical protein AKJ09_03767 [Labilithrix luteola]|uniref:Uncharacterized protein n=1 Tax=Labilithrix luteola TaxID=1391654 RepID=A0A0K1PU87_9BACT|nr:hypothetical protein AKJ09_03767 [Labilithrix luteola]